jgi:hypothetical protein
MRYRAPLTAPLLDHRSQTAPWLITSHPYRARAV